MEEFALCWNNFTDNIVNSFTSLYLHSSLSDVTLAVDGKLFKAHKIVLSICSPYFQRMFTENPCKHPIIILNNMSAKLVNNLLEFMYRGSVNVLQTELQAFMKTAEALQIKGLATNSKKIRNENFKSENEQSESCNKRTLDSDEHSPIKPKSQKTEATDEEVTDLTNEDENEPQSAEDLLLAVPEITMIESRSADNNSTKSRGSTDGQESSSSNIRISAAQTLNIFSQLNNDFPNDTIHLTESSAKASSILDIPVSSASGSNITMLSSTSLLHGNCIFNRNNTVATQQGLKTYWLCKSYRISMCKARCITHQGKVISATGVHNHIPHMNVKQELPPGHTPNICNPPPPPINEFNPMPSASTALSGSSHHLHNNPAQQLLMPQPYHPYLHPGIPHENNPVDQIQRSLHLSNIQMPSQDGHEGNKMNFNSSQSGSNNPASQLKFEHHI